MTHIDKLVKKATEPYETHNRFSAVNLLISGGIKPVSLLLYRYLLSQNTKSVHFVNADKQSKRATVTF
jgi:hypothetical protein